MKKFALIAAALLLAGCSYKNHNSPGFGARFASVDYTVLGETSAEACGTYVFAIDFGHLFVDKAGATSGGGSGGDPISALLGALLGGGTAEEARALYEALDKMPEATNLAAYRSHVTNDGLTAGKFGPPIFGRRCATIVAHGVKMGKGPVPNAN
ncbi:hypothetical protein LBMAG42_04830 [Deltaproteobacteria bacterium]|nr:hypothetical protein LBMAG42_04830 [Deltaproteobacteria bacterium]